MFVSCLIKVCVLSPRDGKTILSPCILPCFLMIFSAVFTFASAVTLIKVQQSNTEIVFDSFIANNSILIYNNIKMGKNATDGVKTAELTQTLVKFCSLTKSGTPPGKAPPSPRRRLRSP